MFLTEFFLNYSLFFFPLLQQSLGVILVEISITRSSHPEVFLGKGFLKIYSKFTGEHLCRSVISIKLLICCIISEHLFLITVWLASWIKIKEIRSLKANGPKLYVCTLNGHKLDWLYLTMQFFQLHILELIVMFSLGKT